MHCQLFVTKAKSARKCLNRIGPTKSSLAKRPDPLYEHLFFFVTNRNSASKCLNRIATRSPPSHHWHQCHRRSNAIEGQGAANSAAIQGQGCNKCASRLGMRQSCLRVRFLFSSTSVLSFSAGDLSHVLGAT